MIIIMPLFTIFGQCKQGLPVTAQVAQNVPTTVLKNTKMFFQIGFVFFLHVIIKKSERKKKNLSIFESTRVDLYRKKTLIIQFNTKNILSYNSMHGFYGKINYHNGFSVMKMV